MNRLSADRQVQPSSRQSTPNQTDDSHLGAVGGAPLNQSLYPQQPESSDDRNQLPFSSANNDRVRNLLDSRGGPASQSQGALRDTTTNQPNVPAERMTRDPRGDWVPRKEDAPSGSWRSNNKPDWTQLETDRQRPFATRLPSLGENVDPTTSHGRFLTGLLGKMEDREKRAQQGSVTDTESVRSYRLSYNEKPRRVTKLGFPYREDDESADSHVSDEVRRLRRELRDAKTTINRMQQDGYATSASDYDRYNDRPRFRRDRGPEIKNLKVPKFNGKDFAGFKLAFMKCAKLLRWDEEQAQTQLICTCEGTSRNVLMSLPDDTSVIDMLHALELRYGINLSYATVDNKLVDIRRKPGETLHSLYDRVMELARRADYTNTERAYKTRHAFFQALRTDIDLQHYVGRHDKADPPSIDVTLAYALQYEMTHGRKDYNSSSAKQVTTTECSVNETDDSEAVNRLQFTSLKQTKDPVIRQLGMQQNELVELMKKQAKLLEEHLDQPRHADKPKTGRFGGANRTTNGNQRSNTYQKSSNGKKFHKKGRFDKKKPGFKPRSKVNRVEDEDEDQEEDEEWDDARAEEATSDCSTPDAEEDQE